MIKNSKNHLRVWRNEKTSEVNEFVLDRDEKRIMLMRSDHARFDVNHFQKYHVFFRWVAHYQNVYVVNEICVDDLDLWIDASVNQIRIVENIKNERHKTFLKDIYDNSYAIDDVINQLENDVSLQEKALYSDQINALYATFFKIVQQSRVKDVIERFDYVQQ